MGVVYPLGEAFGSRGEVIGGGLQIASAEREGAKRLAEESNAFMKLGGGAVEEGEGLLETVELGGREGDSSGMTCWESEDLGFCLVQEDTKGGAKALEGFNENWEVLVRKERESIVEVGVCSALRATTVVAMLVLCTAGLST